MDGKHIKYMQTRGTMYDHNCVFVYTNQEDEFLINVDEFVKLIRDVTFKVIPKRVHKYLEVYTKRESTAWCPDCSDSLETIAIYRKDKKYGKVIDHFEYFCLGCDKTFVLKKKK